MGIAVCETEKAELYPIFFFFECLIRATNIRKSVAIRYQIRLLFRSSNHGISRRDISTFKSLLVRLFYIYSRYVHFYICAYMWEFIFRILFFWPNYSYTFERVQFLIRLSAFL